jgi:hypothetical protein
VQRSLLVDLFLCQPYPGTILFLSFPVLRQLLDFIFMGDRSLKIPLMQKQRKKH